MVLPKIREPRVAGTFYSADKKYLLEQIKGCIFHKFGPNKISEEKFVGAVVPHAGYVYSGPVAAWIYASVRKANYIIVGPNHYGVGYKFATYENSIWQTPLGEVIVDNEIIKKLKKCGIEHDARAHEFEHSVEVQLPFLQFRFGNEFKFVPISILHDFPNEIFLKECMEVGKCIGKTLKNDKKEWILIASSDFSHYISHKKAKEIDRKVIREIERMDPKRFFKKIVELDASVCGYGAIVVVMEAAKELGAKKGKLITYKTSGDVTGDRKSVVGYAAIKFM